MKQLTTALERTTAHINAGKGYQHRFILRDNVTVEFTLPKNLTNREGNRLGEFAGALTVQDWLEDEGMEGDETDDEINLEEVEDFLEPMPEEGETINADTRTHYFYLRYDWVVALTLPKELTYNEADRLSRFMQTLSFKD